MKTPLVAAVALIAFAGNAWAKKGGQDPKVEEAVKATVAEFVAAFNKGDAKGVAAQFTEDGTLVNVFGMEMAGRAAIEQQLSAHLAGPLKGVNNNVTPTKITVVAPNVAAGDADIEISGMKGPDGKPAPAIKAKGFGVFVKQKGKWLFASARAFVHLPPPGPPGAPPTAVKK